MRKKIAGLVIAASLFTGLGIASADQVGLTLNGSPIQTDVAPIILGGRTLVPLRVISQALGCTVNFDSATNNAIITQSGTTPSQSAAPTVSGTYEGYSESGVVLNGKALSSDVPPIIVNGRVMVPVRLVAEGLGAQVAFQNNTVMISTNGTASGTGSSSNNDLLLQSEGTNTPVDQDDLSGVTSN